MLFKADGMSFPSRTKIGALTILVLVLHLGFLLSATESLWHIDATSTKLGALQTRVISASTHASPPSATPGPEVPKPSVAKPPLPKAAPPMPKAPSSGASLSAVATAMLPEPTRSEAAASPALPVLPASTALGVQNEPVSTPAPAELPLPAPTAELSAPPPNTPPQDKALNAKASDVPESIKINYRLTGQERGLVYHALGSLQWQVMPPDSAQRRYEAELRVSAFLIGSRVWKSVGVLTEQGLAPRRHSDSWRGERAAHFDSEQNKISFSANVPSVEMQAGAQDQVSLFIQMASAVASQTFKVGSVMNVQTATTRDAVNWSLTFTAEEAIDVNGERLATQRWVCLPRGKFDSQVEMWLSKAHGGLPVRIKISQVSGNFIDMEMRGTERLPFLMP